MFTKISFLKRKLRGLSIKIFNLIENNGDSNFDANGEKFFIDNIFHVFKNNGSSKIIFDIGANVGDYSKMIKDKAAQLNIDVELHVFEPTKSCFSTISKKFNNINAIRLNNFGASNKEEKATIYYDKEESGLASLYQRNLDSYNLELSMSEEISLRRIDSYIEEKNITHIDFTKIDIEGHELKAFEGFGDYLNGDFISYIQFEYGGANLDSHTSLMDMYKFLESRGFSLAKMMPDGLELRKYKPYMDNFMYSNYVAISNRILEI